MGKQIQPSHGISVKRPGISYRPDELGSVSCDRASGTREPAYLGLRCFDERPRLGALPAAADNLATHGDQYNADAQGVTKSHVGQGSRDSAALAS